MNISDLFVSGLKAYNCEKRAGSMNTFPRREYIAQSKKARIYKRLFLGKHSFTFKSMNSNNSDLIFLSASFLLLQLNSISHLKFFLFCVFVFLFLVFVSNLHVLSSDFVFRIIWAILHIARFTLFKRYTIEFRSGLAIS